MLSGSRFRLSSMSPGIGIAPGFKDGFVGGIERERRHDHFVAGPDIQGSQRDHESGRPGCHAERVGGPEILGEFLLELLDLEYALPFLVKPVSHQDARLHDIHDFLEFLFSEKFCTGHSLLPPFVTLFDCLTGNVPRLQLRSSRDREVQEPREDRKTLRVILSALLLFLAS